MSDLFTLRPAVEDDLEAINTYAYWEGMDVMPSLDNITVAESADGDVVGFIRIAMGANGIAHVNPVVTVETWRGYGVGKALVEDALAKYGELRLVSRGSSLGFYHAVGFENVPWEDIDMAVVDDCEGCEMREECNPQPCRKKL